MMKTVLLFASLMLSAAVMRAQELNLQAGGSVSKFKFRDSQGNTLQNIHSTDNFFMTVEYRRNILKKIFKDNFYTDLGIGYYRYGATGSDATLDNYYAWDVTYLGINLGLDYEFYRPGRFTFYAKGEASPEFLLRGAQTLNDQVYDLVGEEDFDTPIIFFRGGLGVQYQISPVTSIYTQYMGGKSYSFKKDSEKLNIISHNFGIGVLINLSGAGRYPPGVSNPANDERITELEYRLDAYSQQMDSLADQAARVNELERELAAKDAEIKRIRNIISGALFDFDGKGLLVQQRGGKVYVTMENDLIFERGSWIVGEEGTKAVEALGQALARNPDLSILIEGHTDDQPYNGSGDIKDNWDLSLKRATAIVEILRNNPNIDPKSLTPAGRGEYDPIASNETPEGRAKNRRIEVIITPRLDEATKILKD